MKRMALSILSLFLPVWAFASSSSGGAPLSLAPPASDVSVIFLGNIFGIVDGVLHGSGSQIMGNMFGVFNSAVLALGGIIIMYTLLVSTMNTAQEGQMLGQKWSSIWVPLRATLGLSLLIPKTSGYCLMQIFVMWVIVQGVGAADKVWSAALSYLNRGGVIIAAQMTPSTSLASGNGAVATGAAVILQGQVCMYGLQTVLQSALQTYLTAAQGSSPSGPCAPSTSGIVGPMSQFCAAGQVPDFLATVNPVTVQNANPNSTATYSVPMPNFPVGSAFASLNGICGTIKWNPFSQSQLNSVTSKISNVSSSEIQTAQLSRAIAIQQMFTDLSTVAQLMVNNNPGIVPSNNNNGQTTPYSSVAVQQFGVPYMGATGGPCTGPGPKCTAWGQDTTNAAASNSAPLFTGTEFQGAISDYNGIMLPTLNLVQQAQSNTNANNQRAFIQQADAQGWMLAGSYFFNLSMLNASAINNSNLTDTNTGLDSSSIDVSSLLTPLSSPGCNGTFPSLCTWLSKYPSGLSAMQSLTMLIDNYNPAAATPAIILSVIPSASSTPVLGNGSATTVGFINNSVLITLPGQPGMTPPAFAMKFNFNVNIGQFKLQTQTFPCGGFMCLGSLLGNLFYNVIIVNLFNLFLSILGPVINVIIQSFLAAPLVAIAQIFQQSVAIIQQPSVNPIIALANMGVNYINLANELWILLIGLSGNPLTVIVLPLIGLIMPLLMAWLGVMVAIGFVTAYYIPFLPYMIFTFGSIAWIMAVIEAMVAAPIVALGVTHPEGHDAFGKGEQAIMILMNVFLRPSMMVIGFIAAISLSYVSVWVINAGFANASAFIQGTATGTQWNYSMTQSQNVYKDTAQNPTSSQIAAAQANNFSSMNTGYSGWAGIYGFFFSVIVYTTMYVTVVQKSYTLITYLPDKVLRWVGGQAESIGEQSTQWAEESKKQVETAGKATFDKSQAMDNQMAGKVEEKLAGLKEKLSGGKGSDVGGGESTPGE
ncbi:Phagosome trafficking protein DotA [Legionella massiliensis]|uniref:Phagosome trafficking protein DotA n=2 Tax=Legionella massiliensis TaxID=1034943 RepID=A0A078KQA5_9GAMM|nr:Phagosome trafficking protein DotA [Legionella massiliensis]CEE12298.1 Phagosome trafficking protein DotA [Legionella massiliensis]